MAIALVALIPLILALLLLIVLRQNGRVVGIMTLGSAILLACVFPPFHLSPFHILLSLGMGIAGSLTLLTILLPALFLYHIQRIGGAMTVLIEGISSITSDRTILILLLVFGVAPFLDAVCGMNVGIFVIAPILLTLNIAPLAVACLCIFSQVTIVWGTMGVVTLLASTITGLPATIIGSHSALLLMPVTLNMCILTLLFTGRTLRELLYAWMPVVGTAFILTGGAWIASRLVGVELVGVLTSLITVGFLALAGRLQAIQQPPRKSGKHAKKYGIASRRSLFWKACLPYAILTLMLLTSRIITPLQSWLQTHIVFSIPQIGLSLPLLYLPGLWLLILAVLSLLLLHLKRQQTYQAISITWSQFAPSALAIISFLATAHIMQESGMIATFGAIAVALGTQYIWISPWLGTLSGWVTGSAISGNSLFASLQKTIALHTGLSVPWIIATQNTTTTIGKMLSPISAIFAVSAAGIPEQEGRLLRKIGPPFLLTLVQLMLLLTVITHYSSKMLPLLLLVASLSILFVVFEQRGTQKSLSPKTVSTQPVHIIHINPEYPSLLHVGPQSQAILAYLSQNPQGMKRTQISKALALPIPIVHRRLQSLQAQDYVQRETTNGLYLLGINQPEQLLSTSMIL